MPIRTIVTVIGLAMAGVSALVDAGESSADATSSRPPRAAPVAPAPPAPPATILGVEAGG
ncbi:MAG TPA: hypothetical protein VGL92_15395 [Acidimicrobiia bacterium]|jgi:hypothetical protein